MLLLFFCGSGMRFFPPSVGMRTAHMRCTLNSTVSARHSCVRPPLTTVVGATCGGGILGHHRKSLHHGNDNWGATPRCTAHPSTCKALQQITSYYPCSPHGQGCEWSACQHLQMIDAHVERHGHSAQPPTTGSVMRSQLRSSTQVLQWQQTTATSTTNRRLCVFRYVPFTQSRCRFQFVALGAGSSCPSFGKPFSIIHWELYWLFNNLAGTCGKNLTTPRDSPCKSVRKVLVLRAIRLLRLIRAFKASGPQLLCAASGGRR